MQAQQLTVAVERLNGDIRSITEQISGSESRIAVLENDILRNEESAASLQEEISAGEQDSTEAQAALQRHRAVAKTMEAEGEKLAAEIEALNAEIARLTDASSASGARKDTLKAELAGLTARRTEAQVAQAAAEAAVETARQRLPALEQSVQESTAQRDEAKQDLDDTIKYRRMLEENEKQLANVRSGVELKLKGRKAALDDADAAEQRLGRELDAARQRLSVLRELEKNMDGYQNSVKTVMRAAGARRLRGIIGPVSAILKVEPGCEVAVETALGGALQNIVVENEAAAKAAIALLRNDNAGRATFLPLDTACLQSGAGRPPVRQHRIEPAGPHHRGGRHQRSFSRGAGQRLSQQGRDHGWSGDQCRRQLYRRQRPAQRRPVHPQAGDGRAAGESGQVTKRLPCCTGKDRPLQRAGGCPSGRADRHGQ